MWHTKMRHLNTSSEKPFSNSASNLHSQLFTAPDFGPNMYGTKKKLNFILK